MGDEELYKLMMQDGDECPAGLGDVKVIDLTPHKEDVPRPLLKAIKEAPIMFLLPKQTEHGTEWQVIGEAKGITSGQLTYLEEGKEDGGAWGSNSFEISGSAMISEPSDMLRDMLEGGGKIDVTIEQELGKMPRKMKKALHSKRMSKWKHKVASYINRRQIRIHDAEMVITKEQQDVLSATISGGIHLHSCHDCPHWQDGDEGPQCEYADNPPCNDNSC